MIAEEFFEQGDIEREVYNKDLIVSIVLLILTFGINFKIHQYNIACNTLE